MLEIFKRLSVGLSLIMLSLGFFLLGILPFITRLPTELAMAPALERHYYVLGTAASVFAGTVFLVAACIYFRRQESGVRRQKDEDEFEYD
jgi:hypothetical protein